MRSAGGDTILLPADLTQEEHFDELPFGTRGFRWMPGGSPGLMMDSNDGSEWNFQGCAISGKSP